MITGILLKSKGFQCCSILFFTRLPVDFFKVVFMVHELEILDTLSEFFSGIPNAFDDKSWLSCAGGEGPVSTGQCQWTEVMVNSMTSVFKCVSILVQCVSISVQIFTDPIFLLPFRIFSVDKYFHESKFMKEVYSRILLSVLLIKDVGKRHVLCS